MKLSRLAAASAIALVLSGCGTFRHHRRTPVIGNRVPILPSENSATADPSIASVEVLLPPATANDAWAQPGGTPGHSNGQLSLGTSLDRVWSVTINGGNPRERLAASPVVADGKLFVIDVDGVVHTYSAADGHALWSTATTIEGENRRARFGGGVSVEGGRAFATNGVGDVVAIDAASGAVVWRKKPGGPLRGAPTLANGTIYAISQDNQIYALSQADGSQTWTQAGSMQSQGVFGVGAPAAGQGTIIAGYSSGELNAYRYENGRTLWGDALSRSAISTSVSSLADIDASPVIDNGNVYALGQGGRMVSLEITSGRRLWEQNFAGISTPWVAGEWLFVVTDDARLVCLARSTGLVRWIAQLRHFRNEQHSRGPIAWYGPVLAGGQLVLTNSQGQIVTANPANGSVTRTIEAGQSFSLAPIVANQTLFTLDQRGRLTAWR